MLMVSKSLLVLAFLVSVAHGLTAWPKPQSQTDTGILHQLDSTLFTFNGLGPAAQSSVLLDAFKRFRGIIFLHTPSSSSTYMEDHLDISATSSLITGVDVHVASDDEDLSLETDQS